MRTAPDRSQQPRARGVPSPRVQLTVIPAGLLVIMCLIAYVAFAAGEHHQGGVVVMNGTASVGSDHTAMVQTGVGGPPYSITGNVPWYDRMGTLQGASWPTCLAGSPGSTAPVTFGGIQTTLPDSSLPWWQVVWVQCRS